MRRLMHVVRPEDLATGNGKSFMSISPCSLMNADFDKAIAIFSWQLGGALAVSIGQNLLLTTLKTSIPAHTTEVSAQQVIDTGAGSLNSIAPNVVVLQSLRESYAAALKGTFVLPLVGMCLALPSAAGMQWLNIKRVAEERRGNAREGAVDLIRAEEGTELEEKSTHNT